RPRRAVPDLRRARARHRRARRGDRRGARARARAGRAGAARGPGGSGPRGRGEVPGQEEAGLRRPQARRVRGGGARSGDVRAALQQSTDDNFHFLTWAPVHLMSALRGDGVDRLMDLVDKVARAHERRVATSELNRFFADVIEVTPPPLYRGRSIRVHYLTQ